jgi:hypothetical protein
VRQQPQAPRQLLLSNSSLDLPSADGGQKKKEKPIEEEAEEEKEKKISPAIAGTAAGDDAEDEAEAEATSPPPQRKVAAAAAAAAAQETKRGHQSTLLSWVKRSKGNDSKAVAMREAPVAVKGGSMGAATREDKIGVDEEEDGDAEEAENEERENEEDDDADATSPAKDRIGELFACRINSGLFAVEWERTRAVLERAGVDLTVVEYADGN